MRKKLLIVIAILAALLLITDIGGSFYMVSYALAPNPERQDTAMRFRQLYDDYPETRPWVDSLRRAGALTDTFVVMASGERHHAFVVRQAPRLSAADSVVGISGDSISVVGISGDSISAASISGDSVIAASRCQRTAVIVHGWRDQAIGMLMIARLYEQMGWNIVVPDLHAHGLSDGDAIGMGWNERWDVLQWMRLFVTDTMVVHGISMGAATTMNVAGETMPEGIRSIRFVEDCGYTSVWDEFRYEMGEEFGLPAFPLLHTASFLCRVKYGWSFAEASPLRQLSSCRYPMLFIHGDNDHFVPSHMVHPLYAAKPQPKELWVTEGVEHALSYKTYPDEYARRLRRFLECDTH